MAQPDYLGLCRNCKHSTACLYLKGMQQSVVFCEEFQIALPASGPVFANVSNDILDDAAGSTAEADADAEAEALDLELGLCCDCENRHACSLMTPEGGVWYCEEYR